MGLSNALTIGRSGLLAHQTAIEVAGNNLANMATPGYKKQRVELNSARPQEIAYGKFIGQGVELGAISRQVNEALEGRLRTALGDTRGSAISYQMYEQVEAIQYELSDIDLSTRTSEFFNAWSRLASNPQDTAMRTLVLQEASTFADFAQTIRSEYGALRTQVDDRVKDLGNSINDLMTRIGAVNQAVINQEKGASGTSMLRDQRDQLLAELAGYMDISTVENERGIVEIFSGSTPLTFNGQSRGIDVNITAEDNEPVITVQLRDDQTPLNVRSGELGGLMVFRTEELPAIIDTLDQFTSEFIYQVNRLHSQGQALLGFDSVTGTNAVDDSTLALNDPDAGLDFAIQNGSFKLHLTQVSTGIRTETDIDIDLDGIGTDTSLDDLATQISAVSGVTATVLSNGKIQIESDNGDFQLSFSEDSSGALAALGINTLFSGKDAYDIAVNPVIFQEPARLVAAMEHLQGDNRTALAISALRDEPNDSLDGLSLTQFWSRHVEDIAVKTAQAKEGNEADQIVEQNLTAQQQSISGVNADEETIDLMSHQRAYQASARFISIVDELMQTLINSV